jgi:hypothetical protein
MACIYLAADLVFFKTFSQSNDSSFRHDSGK